MFTKLDNIVIGNQFIALEVFTANGEEGISLVAIEKKKNELAITHKEKRSQYDQLKEIPKKNDCVFLVINNSKIIQKEVDGTDIQDVKTLNKAFPSLKLDDFYYEISRVETKSIIAICRKSYVEELLSDFKSKGVTFSGISLGVCSISQIISYTDNEVLNTNTQTITLGNAESLIKPFEGTVETYEINGIEIQNSYLLGFSAIVGWVLKNNSNTGNITSFNSYLSNEYYQKKFFTKSVKTFVYFLLVILLINFFLFNHFFKVVNNSTADIEANKNTIENIKIVKTRLEGKEERLNTTLIGNNSRCSYIINKIISEIPSSILLNQIVYNPLEKNIKEDEVIATQSNTILVAGKTINNVSFTNWIEHIQKYKEIEKVTISQFGKNETKETIFMLKIAVHETK